MAKINTVMFDFDGTIMDTNRVILQSWQHTFRTFEGRERSEEEIYSTFGEPLYITMKKVLPNIPVEEAAEVYRSYHYDKFTDLISVFPGMLELLKALKDRDHKVVLVTSRLWPTTKIGLDKYGMQKYFDTIVTGDDCRNFKPDPEPVNIALKRLSSRPEESIMIGDTIFDILSAKNAGVKSALVSWALAVKEEEMNGENSPDYIIKKPEDVLEIIG
ncbi:MAG TPA: HAD-IA family hydrolase [Clostridiales bacterium]|nr:HAD-IA family hydrolase [Clostridiales bacterium]